MQRAVRHLQEGKEPLAWCELSRAAGLWVLLKPGLGLGLKAAVGPAFAAACASNAAVPSTSPNSSQPKQGLFNSASHKFIMVIYHTVPSIFDSGHRPAAAWPAEEGEGAVGG